ncbi:MAG: tRNA pseudouridine(55) synthase TruB [Nitrospiraceae bacterium]
MSNVATVTTAALHGVLAVDKPSGWTSHDVVAKVRGLLRGAKVGHAGTLDPAATGVLPVLIGQGTRIAEYLVEWDKEYRAVLRLGATTDTQDATGQVLETRPVPTLTVEQVRQAAKAFIGAIEQVPPMYSAIKVAGVPLYRSARAGKAVAREARTVTVYELDISAVVGADVSMRVRCSKGTYIRTLCADLGEALGCGGHLLSLQRSRVGPFAVEDALSMETVGRLAGEGSLGARLWSLNEALTGLPILTVDEPTAARVRHGVAVPWSPAVQALVESLGSSPGEQTQDQAASDLGRDVRIQDQAGTLVAIGSLPTSILGAGASSSPASTVRIRKVLDGVASE